MAKLYEGQGKAVTEGQKQAIEGTVPPDLESRLASAYGVTPEQSQKLSEIIRPIFGEGEPAGIMSKIQAMLDALELKMAKFTDKELKKQDAAQKTQEQQQAAGSRVEQDAETSQKYVEPEAQDTKFSETVALPDADSSLAENYPSTFGMVTETSDFIKINKETGMIQIVHHSGTQVKIDNSGNVTLHVIGSLKQVVEGDMLLQVAGGLDITSGKGIYMHAPEMETVADQKLTVDAMQVEMPSTTQLKADTAICQVNTVKATALVSAPALSMS